MGSFAFTCEVSITPLKSPLQGPEMCNTVFGGDAMFFGGIYFQSLFEVGWVFVIENAIFLFLFEHTS